MCRRRAHIPLPESVQDLLCQSACTRSDRAQRSENMLAKVFLVVPRTSIAPGARNMLEVWTSTRKLCSRPGTSALHPPCLVQRMRQLPIFVSMRKLTPLLCTIAGFLAKPGQAATHVRAQAFFQRVPLTAAAQRRLACSGHAPSTRHCQDRLAFDREVRERRWCLPQAHAEDSSLCSPIQPQLHKTGGKKHQRFSTRNQQSAGMFETR